MPALLQVENLTKCYYVKPGFFSRHAAQIRAVDDVGLNLCKGEVLGIVGESGCGKTTLAKILAGILLPDKGKILVDGRDIYSLNKKESADLRRRIQMVFQDPYGSLDPGFRARDIILEPLDIHKQVEREGRLKKSEALLNSVGLGKEYALRFPHQLSGGERQRVSIARALAIDPQILILDEPVSSLDVSVQARILNLLLELKKEKNLTYVFISHNLAVISYLCSRIIVMYNGKVVEAAEKDELFKNPRHPYTRYLFTAVPVPGKKIDDNSGADFRDKQEEPGCDFKHICDEADSQCQEAPQLKEVSPGHLVFCCKK